MDEIKNIILEYLENAPTAIRDVAKKIADKPEMVVAIASKYNIDQSKTPSLQAAILLTAIGFQPIKNFRQNLVQDLGINYDQALKISSDINTQIFGAEVVELLKDKDRAGSGEETPAAKSEVRPAETPKPLPPSQEPEKLLPTHEAMVKTDGQHVHSQNVMPSLASKFIPTPSTPATVPKPASSIFKSIVDQKLSGTVHSISSAHLSASSAANGVPANLPTGNKEPENVMNRQTKKYQGVDPYREPIE